MAHSTTVGQEPSTTELDTSTAPIQSHDSRDTSGTSSIEPIVTDQRVSSLASSTSRECSIANGYDNAPTNQGSSRYQTSVPALLGNVPRDAQHSFGPVVVNGGKLHQGDQYYVGCNFQDARQPDRFLESLRFQEMNLRANQVVESEMETFEWIFSPPQWHWREDKSFFVERRTASTLFKDWLEQDKNLFWISGKPGSGKSTLVKFLAEHRQTRQILEQRVPVQKAVILTHYFWLHGSEAQRSLKGALCTLLYQLLRAEPLIIAEMLRRDSGYADKRISVDWSVPQLKKLLFSALQCLAQRVCIFLDALDEYDKQGNFQDLLALVRGLTAISRVKICVSSRQENHLENALRSTPKIRLQDLTYFDLIKTVESKLSHELHDADYNLDRADLEDLTREIANAAEGVFLWALLAVRSLATGFHNHDTIETLRQRLSKLPGEMSELFEQMWARLRDDQEIYRLQTSLYFVLAEISPLSLLTFTLATNKQLRQQCLESTESDRDAVLGSVVSECSSIMRRVPACTAGLLEVVTTVPVTIRRNWDANPVQKESADFYQICRCGFHPRMKDCFSDGKPQSQSLHTLHHNSVQYLHRSVAEFLHNMSGKVFMSSGEAGLQREAYLGLASAHLTTYGLGCRCKVGQQSKALEGLVRVFVRIPTDAILQELQSPDWSHFYNLFRGQTCAYGWTHEIFEALKHSQSLYQDLEGFMAACGNLSTFGPQVFGQGRSWSAYYKGYLLLCAVKGTHSNQDEPDFGTLLKRARVVECLVRNGADLWTPHLTEDLTEVYGMRPQPPVAACWLFVLGIIMDPGVCSSEIVDACRNLATLLLQYRCATSQDVIWSLGLDTETSDCLLPNYSYEGTGWLNITIKCKIQDIAILTRALLILLHPGNGSTLHEQRLPTSIVTKVLYVSWWSASRSEEHVLEIDPLEPEHEAVSKFLVDAFQAMLGQDPLPSVSELIETLEAIEASYDEKRLGSSGGIEQDYIPRFEPLVMNYIANIVIRVPPDQFTAVGTDEWYEQGVLREFHERRRIYYPEYESPELAEYEKRNNLHPSWLTACSDNLVDHREESSEDECEPWEDAKEHWNDAD